MKYWVLFLSVLFVGLIKAEGQFDTIVRSLVTIPSNIPEQILGRFERKTDSLSAAKIEYYRFSNNDFCYFPKQSKIKCGYFKLFGIVIKTNEKFENNSGCDLDYGSFELFKINIAKKKYLILTSIRYGSGTTTQFVYCHLFDITNRKKIIYYPLSSFYGTFLNFGDYDNDEKIDFLQITYDEESQSVNRFKLIINKLDEETQEFKQVEGRYIIFERDYDAHDNYVIKKIKSHWVE